MAIHFRCGSCRHRVRARSRIAGLSAICPGCRYAIQIPSAAECRQAMSELAGVANRSSISEAGTVRSGPRSTVMDRPRPPRPKLWVKAPAAAAKGFAELPPSAVRSSTPGTLLHKAVPRPQPGARRYKALGMGALFLCLAALICAWIPKLCGWVIPLSVAGALAGLAASVLVLYVAQKRLFLPIAGAAGPVVILLAASFFPKLLGPAYMASRAKGGVEPAAIRAVPIGGSPRSSNWVDPDWVDATKATLQLGQVNVQVMSVAIRRARAAKTLSGERIATGEYCFVQLRTQAVVAASEFSAKWPQTQSSRYEDGRLKLTGSADKSYEFHGVLNVEAVDKQRERRAFPVSFQDHVFIFEAPAAKPSYLRLEIASEAWGGNGAFHFTIPGSMIIDERGTLKKGA
jgi:hypothetical protein